MCKLLVLVAWVAISSQVSASPENFRSQVLRLPQILLDGQIDPQAYEQELTDAIEGILGLIDDPLSVGNLDITLPEGLPYGIAGRLSVSELTAAGIKRHQVPYATIVPQDKPVLAFTVKFDDLILRSKYKANIGTGLVHIFGGDGRIDVELKGVTVTAVVEFELESGIQLRILTIQIGLEHDSKVDVTGASIAGQPKQDLRLLSDDGVDYINDHKLQISDIISPVIQEILNSILRQIPTPTTATTTTTTTTTTPSTTSVVTTTPKPNFGVVPVAVPLGLLVLLSAVLGLF